MKIISGKIPTAKKVILYGVEGIGKSTLASKFPNPVFIDTEGSTKELDVGRLPKPTSWEMLKEQVRFIADEKPCNTLVIDTIDWAERLCISHICAKANKTGIEDFGYGNGYVYEKEEIERFIDLLNEVIEAGINVVLTAHAIIRKFEQPDELGAYDRYEMKLGKKTTNLIAPLFKEWADMVLFCNYKTMSVAVDKDGKKHKAQGGKRVMYTTHHPCWDAKNRYDLPDEIPMDYEEIRHILESQPAQRTGSAKIEPAHVPPATDGGKRVEIIEHEDYDEIITTDEYFGLPQALVDLMRLNHISEEQIRQAVSKRGIFPYDMPVKNYPIDYIDGCLIGAWEQMLNFMKENGI